MTNFRISDIDESETKLRQIMDVNQTPVVTTSEEGQLEMPILLKL